MRITLSAIVLLVSVGLPSCKLDNICASYQSYYLISPTQQSSTFSFQYEDSTDHYVPELFALVSEDGMPRKDLPYTEKDKNGLVKSEWPILKSYNKRVVPMEVIIPETSDSLLFGGDDLMFAEVDIIDSVALDSARAAANSVKFNNDQRFYNWYFKDKLVWADEQAAQEEANVNEQTIQVEPEPEKEKKNFLKNLFKKKDKTNLNEPDSIN